MQWLNTLSLRSPTVDTVAYIVIDLATFEYAREVN